ncbi:MAG: 30S ribosomal protein S6 [Proteobacteria bacterium]|nr:30S ribosomal protein S6 [Pseudomonadota bacterium]
MNRYEALLALNTRGKEETIKDTIERLENVLKAEGAAIEQVQRLEKRELAYETDHLTSAYFVNFVFEAAPTVIEKLRSKLKLDNDILLQNYIKLSTKKASVPAAA